MQVVKKHSGGIGLKGGIDTKISPFLPTDGFHELSGFHFDELGSIAKWRGCTRQVNNITMKQLIESGAPADITGVFDYSPTGVPKLTILTTPSGIYRQTGNTWQLIRGGQTGTVATYYDGFVLNNFLYIGNGVDPNLRIDSAGVVNLMGIAPPSAAPVTVLGGAGVLTGVYSYRVTFVNSVTGVESNSSPSSISVSPAAQSINLSAIAVSADPQVNARRLYRTATSGGIYLFLAEISDNTTTVFADNFSDATLGIEVELFANGVPPPFSMVAVKGGIVFMGNRNSSRVFFSGEGRPDSVHPNDFRDLDPFDGDSITGLKRLYDTVVAFKNDSIWNGVGNNRLNITFRKQIIGIGGVSHHSVVNLPGESRLLFFSEDGIYLYNGVSVEYKSLPIESVLSGIAASTFFNIYGTIYKTLNSVLWLVATAGSGQKNTLLAYNYLNNQYSMIKIDAVKSNIIRIIEDGFNNEIVYLGSHNGFLYQFDDGFSLDGAAFEAACIGRVHPKVVSETIKSFFELHIFFDGSGAVGGFGPFIPVFISVNDEAGPYIFVGNIDLSRKSGAIRLRFNLQGLRAYVRIADTSTVPNLIIRGWDLVYKDLQRTAA